MSNATRQFNGPALVQWIENECKALGYNSLHDFGTNNGIAPKLFTDWNGKTDTVPSLPKLMDVADALKRPLVELLIASEVISPLVTPQQAIKSASWVPKAEKEFFINTLNRIEADSQASLNIESDEPEAPRRGRRKPRVT